MLSASSDQHDISDDCQECFEPDATAGKESSTCGNYIHIYIYIYFSFHMDVWVLQASQLSMFGWGAITPDTLALCRRFAAALREASTEDEAAGGFIWCWCCFMHCAQSVNNLPLNISHPAWHDELIWIVTLADCSKGRFLHRFMPLMHSHLKYSMMTDPYWSHLLAQWEMSMSTVTKDPNGLSDASRTGGLAGGPAVSEALDAPSEASPSEAGSLATRGRARSLSVQRDRKSVQVILGDGRVWIFEMVWRLSSTGHFMIRRTKVYLVYLQEV